MYSSLGTQGYTGSLNDRLYQWAVANGATSNNLNDATLQALLSNGATSTNINDAWIEALASVGIETTNINDSMLSFWVAGGVFAATPVEWSTGDTVQWAGLEDLDWY